MIILTHEQEMKLSELLFKALDMGCWHTLNKRWTVPGLYCTTCGQLDYIPNPNPNLFSRSAFLTVFDAVKDREDFGEFIYGNNFIHQGWEDLARTADLFIRDEIASPHFQLEVLKWLLEKDGRLGELEEVMKGEGDANK